MAIEIERKFLIRNDSWREHISDGLSCKQGYMISDKKRTVRVRIMGGQGFLTVKGATHGFSRLEFEYEIDQPDATYMLMLCDNTVEKTRYLIEHKGMTWELDVFEGTNSGLVMAEIELESEDAMLELPGWVGEEVTGDIRYYNASLSKHPFSEWR